MVEAEVAAEEDNEYSSDNDHELRVDDVVEGGDQESAPSPSDAQSSSSEQLPKRRRRKKDRIVLNAVHCRCECFARIAW